jgi:hypothetical protein
MKKYLLGIFLLTFILSCGEIKGILKVFSALTVKDSNGKLVKVDPANYDVSFKIDNKKTKITMKIGEPAKGPSKKFSFNIPAGTLHDVDTVDSIHLLASENGQNYDLYGQFGRSTTTSPMYSDFESCIYDYITVYVCDYPGHCHYISEARYGVRLINYHYEYYMTKFEGTLESPDERLIAAAFNASKTESIRVIDNLGFCHL